MQTCKFSYIQKSFSNQEYLEAIIV